MPSVLTDHLLSLVIFMPLIGAVILMLLPVRPKDESPDHAPEPERTDANAAGDGTGAAEDGHAAADRGDPAARLVRGWALTVAAVTFLLSVLLLLRYDPARTGMHFVEGPTSWIGSFHVNYHVGVDGVSLLLVLLSTFLSLLAVVFSFNVGRRIKEYMVFLLVLETAMTGVFCALDMVLFYVFWEAVLVPMYFLIGIWGHENRIYAAIKFFIFTFAGSILMLVAIVYLYANTGSFSLVDLATPGTEAHRALTAVPAQTMMWLFAAFALAFMIKVPMFPLHTWLPDAHVEAPTAGSVILAGVMLKMGVYGFLRFCLPLFPAQSQEAAPLFVTLAVIGIIYGAIVAAMQPDMKKLVAYSSVSHLGFVMLGIFSFTVLGVTGAVLQSVNHGVSTGMLFFLVGMLYDRRHTREIAAFGGVKRAVPVLAAFFLIAMLSSVALPLTNGFIGEFTILQGSYYSIHSGPVATAFATTGMILSAVYMLWLFQRVFTGPLRKPENQKMPDLGWREKLVLAPLVVMVFWFGCYVTTWTTYLGRPVGDMLRTIGVRPRDLPAATMPAAITRATETVPFGGQGR